MAELEDAEQQIKIRFQVGLLPEIRKFCILNSAATFNDYLIKAEGWWNAEKPRPITIKNSPFNPRDIDNTYVSQNNVNAIKNSTDMTSTNVSPFGNAFSNSEFSVMDISKQLNSTLSKMGSDRNALKQLIASLQTLELLHLDSQNLGSGISQDQEIQAEKQDIKEMIRQVMQEEFKKQNSGTNTSYNKRNYNYENNNRRYNNNNGNNNDYYRSGDARNYNNNEGGNYNQRNNNNNQQSDNNNTNQQSKN
ncbi:hypothetical protein EDC94DRAFT_631500 [Helicostylum pulchrum]|nr:hypothetical protein EDC94DRAFT_631500 [Helicostylum pulchrum]